MDVGKQLLACKLSPLKGESLLTLGCKISIKHIIQLELKALAHLTYTSNDYNFLYLLVDDASVLP